MRLIHFLIYLFKERFKTVPGVRVNLQCLQDFSLYLLKGGVRYGLTVTVLLQYKEYLFYKSILPFPPQKLPTNLKFTKIVWNSEDYRA